MLVGKASGKRSLAAEMDRDMAAKRKKQGDVAVPPTDLIPVAGPSRPRSDKENVPVDDAEEGDELDLTITEADLEWDSLSLVAQAEMDPELEMDVEEPDDAVEQEDGYISPTPSRSRDAEDLSSPLRPGVTPPRRKRLKTELEADLDVDAVSSPPEEARERGGRLPALSLCRSRSHSPMGAILVAASPDPPRGRTSDIDFFEEDAQHESGSTPTPSPSPLTPAEDQGGDLALVLDPEELAAQANLERSEAVAAGWRSRWANNGTASSNGKGREKETVHSVLKRRETTVTPTGRHLPINARLRLHPYLQDAPSSVPAKSAGKLQSRRSLTFLDSVRPLKAKARPSDRFEVPAVEEDGNDVLAKAQTRLAQFR
ncbi:hypothetical protein C8J57DRAFT_1322620 [Mycena rebaudengoi]|nr:hypothetical protein C8J57DRAFT_1322620 [Mycena rebaudengoi]